MRRLDPYVQLPALVCALAVLSCSGSGPSNRPSSTPTVLPPAEGPADVEIGAPEAEPSPPECSTEPVNLDPDGGERARNDTAAYQDYLNRGMHRIFVKSTLEQRWRTTPGITSMETFAIGDKHYLFLLAAETGQARIHRIGTTCGFGNGQTCIGEHPVHTYDWTAGWTSAKVFTVADQPYLMLLKKQDGDVHIHRMNADGGVGPMVYDNRAAWTSGWTTVTVYRAGDETFLLLLKASDGDCHIHRMNADGSVGAMTYDNHARWTSGWSTAQAYTVGTDTFVMLLKEGHEGPGSDVHIHRIRRDGSGTLIEEKITDRVLQEAGWTGTSAFAIGDQRYLLMLQRTTGKARIHALRADGNLGTRVGDYEWTTGWTAAAHYQGPDGRIFRVLLKKETGQVHFDQIHAKRPHATVQLYQHRGTPDADHDTENSLRGFANAVVEPATAGLEIDLVFDGADWRVGHNRDFERYPLFRDFLPAVSDAVHRSGKRIMLEIKDYDVDQGRFELIDRVIRQDTLEHHVKVVSFNKRDQLRLFAENGYRIGLFVHRNPPRHGGVSIEDGLRVMEDYAQSVPALRAELLLRWAHGGLDGPGLNRLERRISTIRATRSIDLRLGFTALPRHTMTAGENDARTTGDLLTKIMSAKRQACTPAPIVVITDHPHAYMTNALH